MNDYRSFYDHPTYFVVVNFGSEIEIVNLIKFRDTLPTTMKVKISSINSGYVTGYVDNNIFYKKKYALTQNKIFKIVLSYNLSLCFYIRLEI